MSEQTERMMKDFEERYEQEHNIFCPFCNHKQDIETMYEHCTYWGEPEKESDQLCDCEHCGKKFRVIENVERTYKTEAIE
jgi:transcription elongation factor Elf1